MTDIEKRIIPPFTRDPGVTWNLPEVVEVLTEAHDYFDNKSDAEILSDGTHANQEMGLARRTKHAIEYVEHIIKMMRDLNR